MKKYLSLSLILLSYYCFAQSNSVNKPNDPDELLIRQLLNNQTEAWNRGDIETFMKTYRKSDSLMFIGKSGVTFGWTNTLNNYKKNYPDAAAMGKLSFNILSVQRLSTEYFYVIGKWHLQRSIGDLSGHYTLLIKKINGEWVIIADHSS
jgi:ketosteroid isomerase-like protein